MRKRSVVAIVGAGVPVLATDKNPVASWAGLLKNGIDRCITFGLPAPPRYWAGKMRRAVESGTVDGLLDVADEITANLQGGEFARWLRETVGTLHERPSLKKTAVLEALKRLPVILATTNYDSLLEEVTGRPAVTWMDQAKTEAVIRGDLPGILHLHGHWEKPDSIVLGRTSYDEVVTNKHAEAVRRALRTMKTLMFVGFGAGLSDPTFSSVWSWARKVFSETQYCHYRLTRDRDVSATQRGHAAADRVYVVSYGAEYDDLPSFLCSLDRPPSPLNLRAC